MKLTRAKQQAGKGIRLVADFTGVTAIARTAVGTHDALIAELVALARKNGVSAKKIGQALEARRKAERVQSMIALVFPFLPNPKLLRFLAEK